MAALHCLLDRYGRGRLEVVLGDFYLQIRFVEKSIDPRTYVPAGVTSTQFILAVSVVAPIPERALPTLGEVLAEGRFEVLVSLSCGSAGLVSLLPVLLHLRQPQGKISYYRALITRSHLVLVPAKRSMNAKACGSANEVRKTK